MKPATFDGESYRCANEAFWPPPHASIGSAEEIRFRFPEAVYERMKAWERACGLKEMEKDKCIDCQFLRNPKGIPVTTTVTSSPPPPMYRRGGR